MRWDWIVPLWVVGLALGILDAPWGVNLAALLVLLVVAIATGNVRDGSERATPRGVAASGAIGLAVGAGAALSDGRWTFLALAIVLTGRSVAARLTADRRPPTTQPS